jgi:hypothetical protein
VLPIAPKPLLVYLHTSSPPGKFVLWKGTQSVEKEKKLLRCSQIVLIGSESHNKSQKEGKWEQKEAKGKKRNEVDVEVTSTWRWLVVHFLIFPHSVGNV